MRETETFEYIRRKYPDKEETWRKVTRLVKFDENLEVKSVGFFISVLSNSVIAGYLTSMGYFLFNFLGDISSKSIFYLFSMGMGNYMEKLWLFLLCILLITIALIYEKRKKF